MMKTKSRRVVVLLSKYHGSNSQLLAIAKHLNYGDVVPVRCELRSRSTAFNWFYRLIIGLRNLLGSTSSVSRWLARLVLNNTVVCNEQDIVLAKTPPFEFPMQILAAGSGAQTYFVGQPKRLPSSNYDLLVSTPSTPVKGASLELEMLPTSFTYKEFQAEHAHLANQEDCWCLLIGGNARGFSYEETHWKAMADYVLSCCSSQGVQWVISTSPRTGEHAEAYLKQRLMPEAGFNGQLYLWQESKTTEQPSVMLMLAAANRVYVTEDSASMLSEAINTRLPVISLRPESSEYNALTTPLAEYHARKAHVVRIPLESVLSEQTSIESWVVSDFSPVEYCWSDVLSDREIRGS